MATRTSTRRHTLVTEECRCPGDGPVAIRARGSCRYMLHRHVRTREHAARHVAHGAFPGCSMQKTVDVAGLTTYRTVRPG